MKNFSELTPEDLNKAFYAADEMGATEEAWFFQDDTFCILLSQKRDGFWVQIKRRNEREYKQYETQPTLPDAYEHAVEMIDAYQL